MKSSIEDQFINFSENLLALSLSKPALRALVREELWTIEMVKEKGEDYISKLHGIGKTTIKKIFQ